MTGPRLHLHVGLHKTGTTAIQRFFRLNGEAVAGQGISYPDLTERDEGNGMPLAFAIQGQMPDWFERWNPKFRGQSLDFDRLMGEALALALPSNAVLLSSEEFSLMDPVVLKRRFGAYSDDVRIFVAVRRQDEWIESCYLQAVRAGLTGLGFEAYLDQELIPGSENHARLHLDSYLSNWANVFGRNRLEVMFFRPGFEPITEILARLGVAGGGPYEPVGVINDRMNPFLARLMSVANRLPNLDTRFRVKTLAESAVPYMDHGMTRYTLMSSDIRRRFMARFFEHNRAVCAEFGGADALEWFTAAATDRTYLSPEEVDRDSRLIELMILTGARALEPWCPV